jgi:hypothetical protein
MEINLDSMSLDQLKICLVDEYIKLEACSKNVEVIKSVINQRVFGAKNKTAGVQSPLETKESSPQEVKSLDPSSPSK